MRIEETPRSNWRVWLSESEQEQLIEFFEEQVVKQVAIELMLKSGLRADEVIRVAKDDIREKEAGYLELKVHESKTGYRETIIPESVTVKIRTIAQVCNLSKGDPIVDVTTRTVQNWVSNAAESIGADTNEDDWYKVSAHDLRRTWASKLVSEGIPSDQVMDWGGWDDHDTFRDHYWNPDDKVIAQHLKRIGLA